MFRFMTRDLLWLMVVMAIGLSAIADRRANHAQARLAQMKADEANERALQAESQFSRLETAIKKAGIRFVITHNGIEVGSSGVY